LKPVKRIVLISALAATILAAQVGLAFLPNVELVTLLFLLVALHLPALDALAISFIFAILEGLIWGLGDWVIAYLWVWPLWMIIVILFKRINGIKPDRWALLGGLFGLMFGFLFAVQHALIYGVAMGIAYWIKGISFDIVHGISNYILILLCLAPLNRAFTALMQRWEGKNGRYDENRG
jgi:energy-coupling factor transport system substrate-specific component